MAEKPFNTQQAIWFNEFTTIFVYMKTKILTSNGLWFSYVDDSNLNLLFNEITSWHNNVNNEIFKTNSNADVC